MKKRIIMFAVTATLAFALTACGTAQTSNTLTSTPEPTVTGTPTPTPDLKSDMFKLEQKKDGTLRIVALKNTSLENVVVPEKINGMTVTEIGEPFITAMN